MSNIDTKKEIEYNMTFFSRPFVATDALVFGILPNINELCVFLQRRSESEKWSLPGRILHCNDKPGKEIEQGRILFHDGEEGNEQGEGNWTLEQTLDSALHRTWEFQSIINGIPSPVKVLQYTIDFNKNEFREEELDQNETDEFKFLFELKAKSKIDRDSRGIRVISIPYMTLVSVKNPVPSELNEVARWTPLSEINIDGKSPAKIDLDHDHNEILRDGLSRLTSELRTRPIGKALLPDKFDISDLIRIYMLCIDQLGGVTIDRSNLRKLLEKERKIIKVVDSKSDHDEHTRKGGDTCCFIVDRYKEFVKYHNFAFNPGNRKKQTSTN